MPTLEQDLDSILADELFGTCVTLANGTCIDGIFTDASEQANLLTNEIEAVKPSVAIKTTKATLVADKATVTINDADYIVERKQRIGTGMTLLYLKTKHG